MQMLTHKFVQKQEYKDYLGQVQQSRSQDEVLHYWRKMWLKLLV